MTEGNPIEDYGLGHAQIRRPARGGHRLRRHPSSLLPSSAALTGLVDLLKCLFLKGWANPMLINRLSLAERKFALQGVVA